MQKVGPRVSSMYIPGIWRWWVRLPAMETSWEESNAEPRHSFHVRKEYCRLGIWKEDNILRVDGQRPVRRNKVLSGQRPDACRRTIWIGRIQTRNRSNSKMSECRSRTRSRIGFGWRTNWRTSGRERSPTISSKREKSLPKISEWSVGDKGVNAEARRTLCVMKNLRIRESKIRTEREREVGTKNSVIFKKVTVTIDNNL